MVPPPALRRGRFLPFFLRSRDFIRFLNDFTCVFFSDLIRVIVLGVRLVPPGLRDLTDDICELLTELTDLDFRPGRGDFLLDQSLGVGSWSCRALHFLPK